MNRDHWEAFVALGIFVTVITACGIYALLQIP